MGAEMWPLRPDRYYADEDYLRDPEDGTREFYHDPTKIDPLLGKRPLLIWLEDLKDRPPGCREVCKEPATEVAGFIVNASAFRHQAALRQPLGYQQVAQSSQIPTCIQVAVCSETTVRTGKTMPVPCSYCPASRTGL